jgi:hypothetical protein
MERLLDPEQASRFVLEKAGHHGPPTDLGVVCQLWPGLSVTEEDLDKEGYLVPLGIHGAELLIRKQDSPLRKAFTLAHELGHWVLAHVDGENVSFGRADGSSRSFSPHHVRRTPEEIWCNRFAASLLMPKEDIYRYLQEDDAEELLNRILVGSSVFHVSQEAFFNRVADVTRIGLFEVVVSEANAKVRRSFTSQHEPREQLNQVLDRLLGHFLLANGPPHGPILIDPYRACSKLIHASRYSRSWLVAVSPTNDAASPS